MSFYSLSVKRSDGTVMSMEDVRGKVVYATNVASRWGLTRAGYSEFEKLSEQWGSENLVIMAFPSREFGAQEFETNDKIQEFAASRNFPSNDVGVLMALGKVTGDEASEVWKHMKEETGASDPSWNFGRKFLVSKTGAVSVPKANLNDAIRMLVEENEE